MEIGLLLVDLEAESADLDRIVAPLAPEGWATPTPAEGWTVAHQIGHLAWTDDAATLAATDGDAFGDVLGAALNDPDGFVDRAADAAAASAPDDLLQSWRDGRRALGRALASVPDGARIPWFGPPMSAPSMATARLMETWAHGQDVADALGVERVPTDRLRHVSHIAVRARGFAYTVHGLAAPDQEVRVELEAPSGEAWSWGPADASEVVSGPALDFCLLATKRRNRDDLSLVAHGDLAEEWLGIIQAFAGPPGGGRPPLGAARI
jgi:uncharacterized protein (TIGR03084 family)